MEREIKFAVYHKGDITGRIKLTGYERIGKQGWEWMCLELNPDKGERWIKGVFPSTENYIRVQYTGFKDRNKVEIYEGHIIKYDIDNPISHHRIFYDRKEARWFDDRLEDGDSATNYYDFDFVTEGVVIGNIHENPEMLQQFKYIAQ